MGGISSAPMAIQPCPVSLVLRPAAGQERASLNVSAWVCMASIAVSLTCLPACDKGGVSRNSSYLIVKVVDRHQVAPRCAGHERGVNVAWRKGLEEWSKSKVASA